MPTDITLNSNTSFRCLLIVHAVVLPGLTGCSTVGGTVRLNHTGGYAQIAPRTYNPESRSFDRPWPLGPEANHFSDRN